MSEVTVEPAGSRRRRRRLETSALGGLAVLVAACGSLGSPSPPRAAGHPLPETPCPATAPVLGGPTFPIRVVPGQRYLVDATGRPFWMQGDAAWSLIAQLRDEDVDRYLDDRKAKGFNTLLVSLIEHKFATNAPNDIYGDPPFTTPGDYSTPNDAYFAHAESVLRRAAEKGFLVLLAPSYTGFGGGDEGWYHEMRANGADKLQEYGRYVGRRFRDLSNIVWVEAGDYNPPDTGLVDALAAGIAEELPSALQIAHPGPETSGLSYWQDRRWLAVNSVYTYHDVYVSSIAEYERSTMPFFLIEADYENEHEASTQRLRAQAYDALVAGATGQVFGNNPIWHFDGPGLFPEEASWQDALDQPGSLSMARLGQIVDSLTWWKLRPDLDGALLTAGGGRGDDRAVAALACDGTLGVVYVPKERTITLDLGRFAGSAVTLTWYDPTADATVPAVSGPVHPTGQLDVTTPGTNAEGWHDWLLIAVAR
jgi:hypothetical protein